MSKKRKFKHITNNENSDDSYDSDDGSSVLVESIENHIYFYCDVSQKSIFELIKAIHALNNRILSYSAVIGQEPHEIFLHINSDGGEIFAALAAVDHIISSKVPITTIIEGVLPVQPLFSASLVKKTYKTTRKYNSSTK